MKAFNYFFDFYPAQDNFFLLITAGFFLLAFISSIIVKKQIKKHNRKDPVNKLFKKFPGKLQYITIVGLIMLSFRYLGIPYITPRSLFILIALFVIYISVKEFFKYQKTLPQEIEKTVKQTEKNKYLPGKKRK